MGTNETAILTQVLMLLAQKLIEFITAHILRLFEGDEAPLFSN